MGFVDLHGGRGRRYGSLGLALERPFTKVRLTAAVGVDADGPDAVRAARCAKMLAEYFDLSSGVRIDVQESIPPHAGLGSGTQLALSVGVGMAKLFDYHDSADDACLVLETNRLPPPALAEKVARDCAVAPDRLTLVLTPTGSLAGVAQIASWVVEVALHKAHELGFPLDAILEGAGSTRR